MSNAEFTINGTAFATKGYDAAASSTVTLQLAANPAPDVFSCIYSVVATSKGAPALSLSNGGVASPVTAPVTAVLPGGAHSYVIRCQINGGAPVIVAGAKDFTQSTKERMVAIRTATSNLRKIVVVEQEQYSATGGGWADAQNEEVDAVESALASAGGLTWSSAQADIASLRTVVSAQRQDKQTRFVASVDFDYAFSSGTGAGVADDGDLVVKPNDVLLANNGRWNRKPATTESATANSIPRRASDGTLRNIRTAVGTAVLAGFAAVNTTAAAAGAQQYSPAMQLSGAGWDTTAAASRAVDFALQVRPVQGATPILGELHWLAQINAGGYSSVAKLDSTGQLSLLGSAAKLVGPVANPLVLQSNTLTDQTQIFGGATKLLSIYDSSGSTSLDAGARSVGIAGGTVALVASGNLFIWVGASNGIPRIDTLTPGGAQTMVWDSTVTSVTMNIPTRAGTGANAGASLKFAAQQGQQVAGGANNAGGSITLAIGATGIGGTGATYGAIKIDNSNITPGTMPTIGLVRTQCAVPTHNGILLATRNNADSLDAAVVQTDSSDRIYWGGSIGTFRFVDSVTDTTTSHQWRLAGTTVFSATTAGLSIYGPALSFLPNGGAITISQAITAGTGATNGTSLTVQAQQGQAQTGGNANNNGGALNLSSGIAGTGGGGAAGIAGAVSIQAGGVTRFKVDALGISFFGAASVAQQTRAGQLTGAFGSTGTAIVDAGAAYSQTNVNNNFRVLEDAYNRLETIIHNTGLST